MTAEHYLQEKERLSQAANEGNPGEVVVKVRIDQTELDEVMRKCERIRDLTKEASSLAGELASEEKTVKINFECDG